MNEVGYNIITSGRGRSRSPSLQYDEEWNGIRRTRDYTTKPPEPTTLKPTTPKPTTPKPTTPKPTTTTTRPNSRESEVHVDLPVGSWFRDKLLNMWVLLRRNGRGSSRILIATPGERPKKVSRNDYIKLRRRKLGLPENPEPATPRHDRMKADDPGAANRPAAERVQTGQTSTLVSSGRSSSSRDSASSGSVSTGESSTLVSSGSGSSGSSQNANTSQISNVVRGSTRLREGSSRSESVNSVIDRNSESRETNAIIESSSSSSSNRRRHHHGENNGEDRRTDRAEERQRERSERQRGRSRERNSGRPEEQRGRTEEREPRPSSNTVITRRMNIM